MKTLVISVLLAFFCFGCNKSDHLKISEIEANKIVYSNLSLSNKPPVGGNKDKDEFGCVVNNGEPPMTKCIESTGSTCSKLHACESVLKMRQSGLYTEKELKQSEEISTMFNQIYHAGN